MCKSQFLKHSVLLIKMFSFFKIFYSDLILLIITSALFPFTGLKRLVFCHVSFTVGDRVKKDFIFLLLNTKRAPRDQHERSMLLNICSDRERERKL